MITVVLCVINGKVIATTKPSIFSPRESSHKGCFVAEILVSKKFQKFQRCSLCTNSIIRE